MTAIGVFVATRWESAAVRQAFAASEMRVVGGIRCAVARQGQVEWWVIPMGVGPERATTTAGRVLGEQSFAAVWSTGFACALGQAVIGEVLIGTHVTMEGGAEDGRSVPCAAAGADWVRQAVQQQRKNHPGTKPDSQGQQRGAGSPCGVPRGCGSVTPARRGKAQRRPY